LNVGFYLQPGLFLKNKFLVGIGYILMRGKNNERKRKQNVMSEEKILM